MASLDNLQPDQRAVLQMVLQRGRSYDEIANLLGIDRAAVRQRALDALDALTPMAAIPGPERALVTDYLLGQLPAMVAEQVLGYLEASEPDRQWGLAMSRVLAPLAPGEMPEIPVGAPSGADVPAAGLVPEERQSVDVGHEADSLWPTEPEPPVATQPAMRPAAPVEPEPPGPAEPAMQSEPAAEPVAADEPSAFEDEADGAEEEIADTSELGDPAAIQAPVVAATPARLTDRERERQQAASAPGRRSIASSRRLWLWGILTILILAAVVVIVVVSSGSSNPTAHHRTVADQTATTPATPTQSHTTQTATHTQTATRTTQTATHTTQTGTRTTPQLRRLALLHLSSPTGVSGTTGIAQVVRDRGIDSVVITAQGAPATTAHDAYAVWLSNSLADSVMVGWVPNVVGKNGVLSTEGTLPFGAGHYHRVLITLETQAKPTEPGQVVLAGVFREHS